LGDTLERGHEGTYQRDAQGEQIPQQYQGGIDEQPPGNVLVGFLLLIGGNVDANGDALVQTGVPSLLLCLPALVLLGEACLLVVVEVLVGEALVARGWRAGAGALGY
jgi:hypothetical protein